MSASKVYPALCLIAAMVIAFWPDIHAHGWSDPPTAADLLACTLIILGVIVWEIRDLRKRTDELAEDE